MLLDAFICSTQGNNDAHLCKIVRCNRFSGGNMSIPSKQRSLHNMEFISYVLNVIEIASKLYIEEIYRITLGVKSLFSQVVIYGPPVLL